MFKSIWSYVVAGLLAVSVLGGGAYWAISYIQQNQIAKDENVQLKQALKDIEELKVKTKALDDAQANIVLEVQKKNYSVTTKHDTIVKYINSPEARASDRESSTILKETVRKMAE